jgi:2,3-bisphosphoglycerate-dependent phosphoglycerate mutase
MTLIVVRHGESIWNKENRFAGWTDIELSEEGIQQAILLGEKLKTK